MGMAAVQAGGGGGGGNTGLGSLQQQQKLQQQGPSPPLPSEEQSGVMQSGAESTATHVTTGSNAFEGALDGFDFGNLDSFGLDPALSFSGELLDAGYQQMDI